MGRIMALDVGAKTIGVAFSDDAHRLALPARTIQRRPGWKKDIAELRRLVHDEHVVRIVVGMPLMLDGSRGIQAQSIEDFAARLRGSIRIPLVFADERFTTVEAERGLRGTIRDARKRKEVVDSVAAGLILQAYLDGASSC